MSATIPKPSPPPAKCFHCGVLKADCDRRRADAANPDANVGRCCGRCQHKPRLPKLPRARMPAHTTGRLARRIADELLALPNLYHLNRDERTDDR
jgi:hypothetical protein